MTERLDIDELSEDRVIVYCPNPNCNVFSALGREEEDHPCHPQIVCQNRLQ